MIIFATKQPFISLNQLSVCCRQRHYGHDAREALKLAGVDSREKAEQQPRCWEDKKYDQQLPCPLGNRRVKGFT